MERIHHIDFHLIQFLKKIFVPGARLSLFIVFFWFGILKVLGFSPAGPLIETLYQNTIGLGDFDTFYLLFALFECLIGILFLIPSATRVVIPLLLIHMITTFGPLVFLPEIAWQKAFVPTLEGQYIIKNLVIIALALGVAAEISPLKKRLDIQRT